MKKISHKRVEELLKVLKETKNTHFKNKQHNYPYTEWERNRTKIKERLSNIHNYIHQAVEIINLEEQKTGRTPKLDLEQKTNLFILTRLLNKSNRAIEEILPFLQPFVVDVELSYKYIERLYSDPEVKIALHNVFILPLKDEKVSGDLAGDGTGYAVSVENQHYHSSPEKHGKKFVHFFSLIDIASGMYVGCGVSKVSEMDAYTKAVAMLKRLDISLKSLRLDKYFSCRKIIQQLIGRFLCFWFLRRICAELKCGRIF
jgi:transposase